MRHGDKASGRENETGRQRVLPARWR